MVRSSLVDRARLRTIDVNGHLVWIHDPKSNCRFANQPLILDPLQLLLQEFYDFGTSNSGLFFCHHCIDIDADTRNEPYRIVRSSGLIGDVHIHRESSHRTEQAEWRYSILYCLLVGADPLCKVHTSDLVAGMG